MSSYISNLNSNSKKRDKDIGISILLFLYIFSSYIVIRNIYAQQFARGIYYCFLVVTILKLITKKTPLKVTAYSIWYLALFVLSLLSVFYAINKDFVYKYVYEMVVCLVVSFAYIQYVQNYGSFRRILQYYAYSPIILVLYLFISGEINTQGERLGQILYGNANILGMIMMLSLFCLLWLTIYSPNKYWLANVFLSIIYLYIIGLSGGRKYFVLPFIFFSIMLILKYWRDRKLTLFTYFYFLIPLVIFGVWAIMNIPLLYENIGSRFEGLLNFLWGDLSRSDSSTMIRYWMISRGYKWFLEQPLLGYGMNNFSILFTGGLTQMYAHNNYIELMVDLGIIGLITYYSFYIYLIVKLVAIRNDTSGIRNFFLILMLVFFIFEIGAVTFQFHWVQVFIALASAYVWLYGKKINNLQQLQPT